ncbi:MAG: molybdopterin-guanine dinucleotide biosynthesis protein B [Candidatus Schekmanbacteria bacterium RBG_13_48_7]|uniref:Molybdopterin-guanine dinucleotide biosynthesis protein B n=1 Tax=Candidatus Schekmanbacteria bacterium RBG_13_48_7 TaxID=1817878 RepID=A0A1F7RW93_9BACT|nr:MAG: molybdopterin-guanine dinucleotide biosynthesis protein B [Candidatus Schekmanbacteria bacterium RBG_13_48_7]
MAELGVVGAKNSGKTTVIEGLVKFLVREGYRVATIKHTSHSHRFDTPGKDTYRHRQAGAMLTIAAGKDETAIFAQPDLLDIQQFQSMIHQKIDIWLIEGDRCDSRRKILVARHLSELPKPMPENIIALIGPERLENITVSFEADDFEGLGSFVKSNVLNKIMEIHD